MLLYTSGTNYGQGSSREHAALAPLYLGVKAIICKSFARIHRQNLINNGILPLEFVNEADYDRIEQGDDLVIANLRNIVENGAKMCIRDSCKINYDPNCPFYGTKEGEEPWDAMFDTDSKRKYLQSDGHAVYKFAVNAMANAVKNVAAQGGYDINDLDIVIPHQANLRIIKKATEILGIPEEKVYTNIARMGNVSSACIPVCLDEMRKQGMVKPGQKICFVGFGAGLTYGCLLYTSWGLRVCVQTSAYSVLSSLSPHGYC